MTDFHIGRALVSPEVFESHEVRFDNDATAEHTVRTPANKAKQLISTIAKSTKMPAAFQRIPKTPAPHWLHLYKNGEQTAEILLSAVLLIDETATEPKVSSIPRSLCPPMERFK